MVLRRLNPTLASIFKFQPDIKTWIARTPNLGVLEKNGRDTVRVKGVPTLPLFKVERMKGMV